MVDEERISKLKLLLKDLFQFENNDLDFGIYRIINIKRKEISEFIDTELFEIIKEKIKTVEDKSELEKSLESLKKEIETNFGCTIEDAKNKYAETPKVKDYLEKEKEIKAIAKGNDIEEEIYDDIINFFSRYYDKGDFISKRRYSKDSKYAIPYNGEEVYLHWANSDQYYIKTGENFKNYSFKAGSIKVDFEIVSEEVDIEKNNIKDTENKFFIFKEAEYDSRAKHLVVNFGYRGLASNEETSIDKLTDKKKIGKDEINLYNLQKINEHIGIYGLSDLQKKHIKMDGDKSDKSELEWHLNKYTTKNTSDYFIHKDLKKFLVQELDFYIKNEILHIDDIDSKEDFDINLNKIKVFKQISLNIIDFLAQVEEFQKKLWEKKKFVISTDYCITLDYIDEKYYLEIIKNEKQIEEWNKLYSFDINVEINKLSGKLTGISKTDEEKKLDILRQNQNLVIDTKLYEQDIDFKYQLLSEINNLEDKIDGILVNSENFQALTLINNKFNNRINCCYIDPPFNLGENPDYLYKVDYKDSTWTSMLSNSISAYTDLMAQDGSIFVRCNHDGNMLLRLLLNKIFSSQNYRNEIIVRRAEITKGDLNKQFSTIKSVTVNYDNIYWYSKNQDHRFGKIFKPLAGKKSESHWHSFWKAEDRPNMRYEILGIDLNKHYGQWMWSKERAFKAVANYNNFLKYSEESGEELDTYWQRTGQNLEFITRIGDGYNSIKYWIPPRTEIMADNNWLDIKGYANQWGFKTENSEPLLRRIIEHLSQPNDFVIDFFGGSGTTAAAAHKLKRKWICVEMGKHFGSILLPRMKLVLYGENSGVSKETNWKGGGLFKYQSLEQYEDSLNNIDFKEPTTLAKESKDYRIKYMLEFESRGSNVFLNLDALDNPFKYKLKVYEDNEFKEQNVDLIETFNYIAGIDVKSIQRKQDDKVTYVIVKGNRKEKDIIVIWRNRTDGFEPERDKEFIETEILNEEYDEILVNGNSLVENAKSIDEIFKSSMFRG